MRARLATALCLLAAACSAAGPSPEARRRQRLMEEVEARVAMPRHASRLGAYARFYRDAPGGNVAATYVLAEPARPASKDGCAAVDAKGGGGGEVPCPPVPAWPPGAGAGERKWVGRGDRMISIADGGCSQVNILYDPARRRFEEVSCNSTYGGSPG